MQRAIALFTICLLSVVAADAQTTTKTLSKKTGQRKQDVSSRLDALQSDLDAQREQIQQLQQQVQGRDAVIEELRQQLNQTQNSAKEAEQTAQGAAAQSSDSQSTVSSLRNEVVDVRGQTATINSAVHETNKKVSELEQPAAIRFKGITLTPGGFFDATGIYRSHNQNADVISTFGSIPFSGSANSHLSEFRGSGRATRLSLLAEGMIKGWKASGYFEMDFAGAAPTANEIESNSFQPRSRQLWGQVESKNGWSFAGGQTWSLLSTNKNGIALRQEWVPMTIDLQYVVGYNWARQWSARVTKKLNDKLWAAVSVENPETTVNAINAPAGISGFNSSANAQTPGSAFTLSITPGANGISTDTAPDFIGKLAFEPGWGHFEVKALGRVFRDRFNGTNNYTAGGGGGIAAILPVTKKIDVIAEGMAGTGIGRYASGLGADVTVKPDGTIIPIRTLQLMAGVEAHPTPKLDWYVYGGNEYYSRAAYQNATGQPVGYGSPLNNNSGCEVESPTASQPCQAQNRNLWEVEPGFWYRFYKGSAGAVAIGASYSYIYRNTWAGLNSAQPKGIENMVMTSFRYYIP
jgi:TolA-binding protein